MGSAPERVPPRKMVFLPRVALGARPSQGRVILLHHRNGKWRIRRVLPPLPFDRQSKTDAVQTRIRKWSLDEVMLPGLPEVGWRFCY